ncbi:UNVERIFIED_CONTAM: hypothetical protein LK11_43350 [Mumia flava]|nr:hypothetical protein [Mumia flava]
MCVVLGLAVVAGTLPVLAIEGLLRGTEVMNGSARGTALVMLLVALPVLFAGMRAAERSVRGHAVAIGALAYLTYNAMLLVYATPFNVLFLVSVATLGLAFWTLVSALLDPLPLFEPGPDMPVRMIAGFMLVVVTLNALAWVGAVVPDLGEHPPAFLEGTGLTTNPIYVQDLAFWLPALAVVAVLLWRRTPAGGFLAGAGLVFWLLEAIGVAVDQVLGHAADPTSPVATLAGAWMFVVLAAVTVVPLLAWVRAAPAARTARDGSAVPRWRA